MAQIYSTNDTKVFAVQKWLGLNESPDGDTGLKMGEAAEMRNFRVTRENHLQVRPGYAPMVTLADGHPVRGVWSGYVAGAFHLLAACGGRLWDVRPADWSKTDLGAVEDAETSFFGFSRKVYLLTGSSPRTGRTRCSTWWRGRLTRCWPWRGPIFPGPPT